ncbi:MAG: rRNA maturation RNase YbeY [Ignavibacteriae bacterium]|nr:rRNA maturation RNase YbeY [Ignavibacteriota bacterium]
MQKQFDISTQETIKLVQTVLSGEANRNAEVNVVFIDDNVMTKLNTEYLQHHYTTDVLSFCLSDKQETKLEGEVYVNVIQAKRQAKEYGVSLINELGRLVIHGTLHLLGYEDDTPKKKLRMNKREEYYLGNSGLEYFHA